MWVQFGRNLKYHTLLSNTFTSMCLRWNFESDTLPSFFSSLEELGRVLVVYRKHLCDICYQKRLYRNINTEWHK